MVSDKIWSIRTISFKLKRQAKNVFPSDDERTIVGILFLQAEYSGL